MQPHQKKVWEPQVSVVVCVCSWDWLAALPLGSKQPQNLIPALPHPLLFATAMFLALV